MARQAAVTLTVLACALLTLLGTGQAVGGPIESPDPTGQRGRAVLAATGLDLTWPIVFGLTLLMLGTTLVAWLALRGGRAGTHR